MISDRDVAALCSGIYAYPGDVGVAWDHFDAGMDDGVCWAIKRVGDVDVVVLRGSVTFRDWARDFMAWASPFSHGGLGPVHPGFLLGLDNVWRDVSALVGPRVIVAGHSLGAARATLLSGLMLLDERPPLSRVVFGEPKPGFAQLAELVAPIAARSYRNGHIERHAHDVITNLPFTFPPEDYTRPTPVTDVYSEPPPDDAWGLFAYHHMPLYLAALAGIDTATP